MKKLFVVLSLLLAAGCQSTPETPAAPAPTTEAAAKPAEGTEKPAEGTEAAKPAEAPASQAALPTEKDGHFGEPFAADLEAVTLASVLEKADDFADKTVKVTGTVDKVCAKKGCWMVMKPDGEGKETVRITMKGYSFFVPLDCQGKKAVVEGVFSFKEVDEATRKHLAEDEGRETAGIEGSIREMRIVANGITIEEG